MRRFVIWMAAAVAFSFALTSTAEAQGAPNVGAGKVRPLCLLGCGGAAGVESR